MADVLVVLGEIFDNATVTVEQTDIDDFDYDDDVPFTGVRQDNEDGQRVARSLGCCYMLYA